MNIMKSYIQLNKNLLNPTIKIYKTYSTFGLSNILMILQGMKNAQMELDENLHRSSL